MPVVQVDKISPLELARNLYGSVPSEGSIKPESQNLQRLVVARTKAHPSVDTSYVCRDSITALFFYWPSHFVYRFVVAAEAVLHTPLPLPPTGLTVEETANGFTRELWMAASNQYLVECNSRTEEGAFARTTMIPVTDNEEGCEVMIPLRAFVSSLRERFASAFKRGLFDDLDDMGSQNAKDEEREKNLQMLVSDTRGITVLLIAHDERIQRLLFRDISRFFADEVPPSNPDRVKNFMHACREKAGLYFQQGYSLTEIGEEARDAWLFG